MIDFLMLEYLTYATLSACNENLLAMLGNPPESEIARSVWNGNSANLPDAWPVFVHGAKGMMCSREELAQACHKLGHVPFYDDALIGLDGKLYPQLLKVAVDRFLAIYARRQRTEARSKKKPN